MGHSSAHRAHRHARQRKDWNTIMPPWRHENAWRRIEKHLSMLVKVEHVTFWRPFVASPSDVPLNAAHGWHCHRARDTTSQLCRKIIHMAAKPTARLLMFICNGSPQSAAAAANAPLDHGVVPCWHQRHAQMASVLGNLPRTGAVPCDRPQAELCGLQSTCIQCAPRFAGYS